MSYVTALAGALGADVIPAACWDAPAFKSCHGKMWTAARAMCDPTYGGTKGVADEHGGVGKCIEALTVRGALANCLGSCPKPGAEQPPGPLPDLEKRSSFPYRTAALVGGVALVSLIAGALFLRPGRKPNRRRRAA